MLLGMGRSLWVEQKLLRTELLFQEAKRPLNLLPDGLELVGVLARVQANIHIQLGDQRLQLGNHLLRRSKVKRSDDLSNFLLVVVRCQPEFIMLPNCPGPDMAQKPGRYLSLAFLGENDPILLLAKPGQFCLQNCELATGRGPGLRAASFYAYSIHDSSSWVYLQFRIICFSDLAVKGLKD